MTADFERLKRDFDTRGFAVMDDVADPAQAEALLALLDAADYDRIEQRRKAHYTHVFADPSPHHPKGGETYIATFSRSSAVERNPALATLIDGRIRPALSKILGDKCDGSADLRAYRMDAGDLIRAHCDDYAGKVGFVYYLCRDWKWDWGGLLHVVRDGEVRTAMPGFNRLIAINHGMRLVHFVSPVADYAKHPRYTIVGLLP